MGKNHIDLFTDYFAHSSNVFTRIDARIKLIFAILLLVLILFGNRIEPLLFLTVLCLCMLLLANIPLRVVILRLSGPLLLIGVVVVLQSIFFGETTLLSLSFVGIKFQVYEEGFYKGILIASRIIAGTSLVLLLSMTTPLTNLLGALKYLKIPNSWIEIASFAYRYIFVFIEEAQSIMDAQRLRLGYSRLTLSLKSWGVLTGSLFTRVYDQANATHNAMILRGYNGNFHVSKPSQLTMLDKQAGFFMAAFFLIMLIITVGWR